MCSLKGIMVQVPDGMEIAIVHPPIGEYGVVDPQLLWHRDGDTGLCVGDLLYWAIQGYKEQR